MGAPVVFFSFDGALNSYRWFKSHPCDGTYCAGAHVDPSAVALLNRIVDVTGAELVRVNHWRLRCGHEQEWCPPRFDVVLKQRGFTGRVRGYTGHGETAADQVKSWLRLQGNNQPSAFCILDADSEMQDLEEFLVRTRPALGLTEDDVCRAVALLGVPVLGGAT